jgi:hypothetical protein
MSSQASSGITSIQAPASLLTSEVKSELQAVIGRVSRVAKMAIFSSDTNFPQACLSSISLAPMHIAITTPCRHSFDKKLQVYHNERNP